MLQVDVALIGGTGIGEKLSARGGQSFVCPTRWGPLRGKLVHREGLRFAVLQRHSAGHKTPPHLVRYQALAEGVKKLRAKLCLASAAVGSLRADWPVGTYVVCTDLVDLTGRRLTMHDRQVVHTPVPDPFPASASLARSLGDAGLRFETGVYVCADGPRFETLHEVRLMGHLGDVVGMTAATEALLMAECGTAYGCLALVTNLGTGLDESGAHHAEVVEVMRGHAPALLDAMVATSVRWCAHP